MDVLDNIPWKRKHDDPDVPVVQSAKIAYPESLVDLIDLCRDFETYGRLRAAGSHWSLSEAPISSQTFVETNDPNNAHPAMGRTLYDVVPECLTRDAINHLAGKRVNAFNEETLDDNSTDTYFVHCEAGKRVYQLYSELDLGDERHPRSLASVLAQDHGNDTYFGPWALPTMGGAGGQTVFGALTTGTHGGDIRLPPIADGVVALHLVGDGGKHYWIETTSPFVDAPGIQLTDDAKLRRLYDRVPANQPAPFEIIRDDDVFNAVLVSAGRMGIVYSVVVKAVRQFCLIEKRTLTDWQAIRSKVTDLTSDLFNEDFPDRPRFLQIAVALSPHDNLSKNRCGVTKRWKRGAFPNAANPAGRKERRGRVAREHDRLINGPRFEFAGASHGYTEDPDRRGQGSSPSFLDRACSNEDFMDGVLQAVHDEVEKLVRENKVVQGGIIATVVQFGAGSLLPLVSALAFILVILKELIDWLAGQNDRRLGFRPESHPREAPGAFESGYQGGRRSSMASNLQAIFRERAVRDGFHGDKLRGDGSNGLS